MEMQPDFRDNAAHLAPYRFPRGKSGNPSGYPSRVKRHRELVAALMADLGGDLGPLDMSLVEQAGWLIIAGEDQQLARSRGRLISGKPVTDEDIVRVSNCAARILLRLRGKRERRKSEGTLLGDLLRTDLERNVTAADAAVNTPAANAGVNAAAAPADAPAVAPPSDSLPPVNTRHGPSPGRWRGL